MPTRREGAGGEPPFATATLARLYLAQGLLGQAAAVLRRVREQVAAGGPPGEGPADAAGSSAPTLAEVERALDEALARREAALRGLLEAVRAARRGPDGA